MRYKPTTYVVGAMLLLLLLLMIAGYVYMKVRY